MIAATIHGQLYEHYTFEEMGEYAYELAKKIAQKGEKFDRIVALARGGLPVARYLSDPLEVKRLSVIQTEMYSGVYESKAPVIVSPLAAKIKGEKILLVDDLVDSGETFLFTKQYLATHGPESITTATLLSKPWTKILPDYYQLESKAWVIFPWEIRETMKAVRGIWSGKGDSPQEMDANLRKLGFTQDQIETFSKS